MLPRGGGNDVAHVFMIMWHVNLSYFECDDIPHLAAMGIFCRYIRFRDGLGIYGGHGRIGFLNVLVPMVLW